MDSDGRFVSPVIIDPEAISPGTYPYPQYSESECHQLKKFLAGQHKLQEIYKNALGTCKQPEFPPGTKKVADISFIGCFKLSNPGSRGICIAHEMSHVMHIPITLYKLLAAECKCKQLDVIFTDEIKAYGAGIKEGEFLYQRHCSPISWPYTI